MKSILAQPALLPGSSPTTFQVGLNVSWFTLDDPVVPGCSGQAVLAKAEKLKLYRQRRSDALLQNQLF